MKTISCNEAVLKIKSFCLILSLVFALAGCKEKEKVAASAGKAEAPAETTIAGQIFIVTKDSANIVLGDVKVALLDESEVRAYVNAHANEWSNSLAMALSKVDEAATNYDGLYKDDLAKFAAAREVHFSNMTAASATTQEQQNAGQWWDKMKEKIRDLHKLKRASVEKSQLDEAVMAQAGLWDKINWPAADHLDPKIDMTTTDNGGHFKFTVSPSSKTAKLMLLAKANRQLGDKTELYWWMAKIDVSGKKSNEVILSNSNLDGTGVCGLVDGKDINIYMCVYGPLLVTANQERSFKDKLEDAEDGVSN